MFKKKYYLYVIIGVCFIKFYLIFLYFFNINKKFDIVIID